MIYWLARYRPVAARMVGGLLIVLLPMNGYFVFAIGLAFLKTGDFGSVSISAWLAALFCMALTTLFIALESALLKALNSIGEVVYTKAEAKRLNEHLKLAASFFNSIGSASFLGLAIFPTIAKRDVDPAGGILLGFILALFFHLAGQKMLDGLVPEEV